MSTKNLIDTKTLAWVRQQVEEHLESARQSLDRYAEDPGDPMTLSGCLDAISCVRGAIEIVGIQGPLMLARELENTFRKFIMGEVEQNQDAFEVMMRGILQLPAYLEHLYHGQLDIPLVLLPLLNDLRALQNADLLTESAFFSPDLSILPPAASDSTHDPQELAKRLRPGYLKALLGVIRDEDPDTNRKLLTSIALHLQNACSADRCRQLWWIAAGLLRSIYEGGLETSVAVKILLGRLDQQIRRLVEEGEQGIESAPPDELLKNLLYYIAQSSTGNELVEGIKENFRLATSLPDEHVLTRMKEELYGFNANLVSNISAQIKEELLKIKDALDIAIHSKDGSTEGMEPVLGRLHSVADALGMLGLTKFRQLVIDHEAFLRPVIDAGEVLADEDVMRIAGALLYIESSLYDLSSSSLDTSNPEQTLPEVEYLELVKVVVAEMLKDINLIKDDIVKLSQASDEEGVLERLLDRVHALKGILTVLAFEEQKNLLGAIESYLREQWQAANKAAEGQELDLLANALTGVEYYLESLVEKSVAPELGLQIAAESLRQLGYTPRKTADERVAEIVEAPKAREAGKPVMRVIEGNQAAVQEKRSRDEEMQEIESAASSVDEVDEELIGVFISEAEEVLNKVAMDLDDWKKDQGNVDIVNRLVRAFHTMKGAGRIIGATSIGVLAWSIEELLRRVADGRVDPSEQIFSLLEQVHQALNQLTAELQEGAISQERDDIQSLITVARELRQASA